MKITLVLLVCLAACRADDLGQAAGQIFNSILPNLIGQQVTGGGQQGNAANTIQTIGTVVGGVVDYAKKKSYDDMLRQVQDGTTDEDLLRLSEEMFNGDINNALNYIQVNLQGKTSPMSKNDEAQSPLLNVPDNVWNGPTIRPFVALFDNYHKNVIRPEFVTPNEETEQTTFINTILATGPIRSLMNYFVSKGITQLNEYPEQVELLRKIWFTKYARHWTGLCKCSCAFENIFMAELKSNEVLAHCAGVAWRLRRHRPMGYCTAKLSEQRAKLLNNPENLEQAVFNIGRLLDFWKTLGLHSWLFFAKREQDRKANYLGYIDKLDLSGKGIILKQHSVLSDTKDAPEITMFVGTSPELEVALYTLCFMARPDRPCRLRYNNVNFSIQTKTLKSENVLLIDTAYPVY